MSVELKVFSYRAECQGDVFTLHHTLASRGIGCRIVKFEPDLNLGEVLVEAQCWNCEISDIELEVRNQIDAHVIADTLRPVPMSDNSMERTRS